jgi:hypothetical protein
MARTENLVAEYPVLSLSLVLVLGAVAYAAISLVMRGVVNPLETGLFAISFGVVYVGFAVYTGTVPCRYCR